MLELFRNLEQPGSSTVQGVWAELLFIAHAPDIATAVAAWHAMPREKFDFAAGAERIEVKSTLEHLRVHHVSIEQVRPAAVGKTLLASFLVARSRDGASIGDLVERIRARVLESGGNHEIARRVETIVSRCLGVGWTEGTTARFDEVGALKALRIFDVNAIPSVDPSFPAEVSEVRFSVDLSSVPALSRAELDALGGFFEALIPATTP